MPKRINPDAKELPKGSSFPVLVLLCIINMPNAFNICHKVLKNLEKFLLLKEKIVFRTYILVMKVKEV
jgi:hypothetical protein